MAAYVAIETKFLGPTNYRGARVKAFMRERPWREHQPQSTTLGWDHAANSEENHRRAAQALVTKLELTSVGRLVVGATDKGYVFVPVWEGDLPATN